MFNRRQFLQLVTLSGIGSAAAVISPTAVAATEPKKKIVYDIPNEKMVYAIGDIHGSYDALQDLLSKLPPNQRLLFLGDVVSKGKDSVNSLRLVKKLCEEGRAVCLLGNNDIEYLGVACGFLEPVKRDKLDGLLAAPDREELVDWFRKQKFAHFEGGALFMHAGVHPTWTVEDTLRYAKEVEAVLAGADWKENLRHLVGQNDSIWDESLTGWPRLRVITNILSRQRFVKLDDGNSDLKINTVPEKKHEGRCPWYEFPNRRTENDLLVFGHWSRCDLIINRKLHCLDTDCWRGGRLTAYRYPKPHIVQTDM